MKWWLINDGAVRIIQTALGAAIKREDMHCRAHGCCCHEVVPCSQYLSNALHELDSGLNETDAIPEDWKKEE